MGEDLEETGKEKKPHGSNKIIRQQTSSFTKHRGILDIIKWLSPTHAQASPPRRRGLRSWAPPCSPWIRSPDSQDFLALVRAVIQRDTAPQLACRVPGGSGRASAGSITAGKSPSSFDFGFLTSKEKINFLVPSDPWG